VGSERARARSRLRVVHLADVVNRHDFIHNVAAHCDPRHFEMITATLTSRGTLNSDPRGLRVQNLGGQRRLALPLTLARLRRLLRAENVAVLHSHHYEPAVIASVASIRLPVRLVVGRHYSDTIYRFTRGLRRRAYLAVEGFCNARAAAVVVPSTLVEGILLRQGVPRTKVVRIPYGLELARFSSRGSDKGELVRQEWPPGAGLRIATVGRLHPEKGQELLIRAMAKLRLTGVSVRLVLVGDGQDRERLAALAASEGIADSVRFLGWRDDVLDVMSAADAVVQPTLNEAFSQVMLESMALGRALVMSDVGGVADLVEDGVSGLVVPIGDVDRLAGALLELQRPGATDRLGDNAARVARERLDVKRIAPQFEALYTRIADRAGSRDAA
jgi:glycosyltransferase involved in cell wall biosynthesis